MSGKKNDILRLKAKFDTGLFCGVCVVVAGGRRVEVCIVGENPTEKDEMRELGLRIWRQGLMGGGHEYMHLERCVIYVNIT